MEELNKNQLIMLALLVSFVTSIATGIVTVSLMSQAPDVVPQTVNRIVERTVERVVPGEPATTTVIQEVPMVITEEQLIVEAINKVSPSVFALNLELKPAEENPNEDDTLEPETVWRGAAFLLRSGSQRYMLTKPSNLIDVNKITAVSETGERFPLTIANQSESGELVRLSLDPGADNDIKALWQNKVGLEFSNRGAVIGQTVVGVGSGSSGHQVSVSIVSALQAREGMFRTNAATGDNAGGPIIDIDGRVLGISQQSQSALGLEAVRSFIDSL